MSSVQDRGRTQDLRNSFFYYNDLPRPLNSFLLSPGIARLNLRKETGKKYHAYKISCRFVEGFFVWM